ncbi:Translation initiation factor eIF-2B subunit gamma [Tolypocladium paradoxum]|uniref:Translation initiation factor eIF2B subunit gamma n=1 Tax=Tolypocladium paradoxum TaxID=94208 RepID=A0A2S4KWM3_9HYPO|nr:Translation initiation factor eIF-2B subunit gamma [Tolypocladium paradoxum]
MPHAVSMPSTGLQALILCGPGSSFPTFTSNPDENPKALLPIANRPMVWYPIDFCLRMGIANITLICPPSASKALTAALKTNPFLTGLPLPRPDILAPVDLDQNTGTAEILRLPEIRELVKADFIVLPCDLVCEIAGEKLLQAWMVKSASLTDVLGTNGFNNGDQTRHSGGLGVWYNTETATPVKGEETDFIATTPLPASPAASPQGSIFPNLSKLVYSIPTDSLKDMTEERKSLPIRHGLLRANPRVRMYTTHRDAHIYIFPQWILDFIKENDRLESIGEDVVGWWAKAGWQAGLAEKLHINTLCNGKPADDDDESSPESISSPRDASPAGHSTSKRKALLQSTVADIQGGDASTAKTEVPPVLAYIHSTQDKETAPLIRRVDTAQLLLAISLQLATIPSIEEAGTEAASPFAHARKIAYPEGVKPRTTITKQDSLIAENVTVEEKTSIKESVVGATEDKDNKLMSSEGLEATEAEMEEVLQEVDEEVAAGTDEAIVD